jgi:uncharacterized NAD(P)/FAD-binding protein YdhS
VVSAERVVLALGNFPPADPPLRQGEFRGAARYHRNPWSPAALSGLGSDDSLLILGTGLTAIDVLAELDARGHRGCIAAVSRHGLLPQAHECGAIAHELNGALAGGRTVRRLVHVVREAAARALAQKSDWRGVMDALRPHVQELWRSLPQTERARFLRHGRAYWDVHRHRIAPEIEARVQAMRRRGQLTVRAARLIEYREEDAAIAPPRRKRCGSRAWSIAPVRPPGCARSIVRCSSR